MSGAPDSTAADDDSADTVNTEGNSPALNGLKISKSTILMEVTDDVMVLFGEIPENIEFLDPNLIPEHDRAQLSKALGFIGNVDTIAGDITETATSAQRFFRLSEVTFSLPRSRGELAAKDGAELGATLRDSRVVAQARFIPVSMTVTIALAAIGPTITVIALQVQLGEISGLIRTNIAPTTQTLRTIRNE